MNKNNLPTLLQMLDKLDLSMKEIDLNSQPENKRLALKLIKKFQSNNLAIAKLIADDLCEECFSLQRLSLEHLFNIFALIESDDFLEFFKNNTDFNIAKTAKELTKDTENLTEENIEELERLNKEYTDNPIISKGYSIYNAAKRCPHNIIKFYDSLYRTHSIWYAHSTFLSAICDPKQKEIDEIVINAIDFSKIMVALIKEKY